MGQLRQLRLKQLRELSDFSIVSQNWKFKNTVIRYSIEELLCNDLSATNVMTLICSLKINLKLTSRIKIKFLLTDMDEPEIKLE